MFTGLVEELGRVRNIAPRGDAAEITVEASLVLEGLKLGDSISVSGVCQTIVAFDPVSFRVEAVHETLQRTRLVRLKAGDVVNLERAMRPSDRLGGHLVQGHVDGLVRLQAVTDLAGSTRLRFELPEDGARFIVEKGSVALDGISLTVAALGSDWFEVEIIPHTLAHTTLRDVRPGYEVHVEWDLIAKYVARMIDPHARASGLTVAKLFKAGFGPS